MSVKTNYFKMEKQEFEDYLNRLKKTEGSIQLLDDKCFYYPSLDIMYRIIGMYKQVAELNSLIGSFSAFSKRQIVQSFLISEIESTNKIENVYSTRHDIFSVISEASASKDKKIISISNTYKELLNTKGRKIESIQDIRNLYDTVIKDAIGKEDMPDGILFRKGPVVVTNGIKPIHVGVAKEENIIPSMEEFVRLYNSDLEIFTRMILCHYLFEHIHPFYDGNGRFGRFLFSNGVYLSTGSCFAFLISSAFANEKNRYYKAFEKAEDRYEFGCLNEYVETMLEILSDQMENTIQSLRKDKEKVDNLIESPMMPKSERMIYRLICEASVFSDYGVSNEEIMTETGVSKRTLMYCLDDLKKRKTIEDTKIGKYSFHRAL